ncbi:hypothetical protein FA10DRAFT_258395 [Acaromyces ingoldii]|uniref:Uncharacterized protein n=1 Tax=Acaromyces ingoldii TaxID=215250 RepID=A0A316Z278_9BASI|nr:hypothetical protein FA10DRAFT_258395 [Acaromyces ingoldii]PWN94283.1 hypothetical protein FA10DRAFT_258395 [Acaromyces ingoldii]
MIGITISIHINPGAFNMMNQHHDQHQSQHLSHFQSDDGTLQRSSVSPQSSHIFSTRSRTSKRYESDMKSEKENDFKGLHLDADESRKAVWSSFNEMIRRSFTPIVKFAVLRNISVSEAVKRKRRNTLALAPPSWVTFTVDNPYGPIEERDYFKTLEQVAFVSKWANEERKKFAPVMPNQELDYMIFDKSTRRWTMRPGVTSGEVEIKKEPEIWWKDNKNKKTPVVRHQERKKKKALNRSRRHPEKYRRQKEQIE